MKVKGLTWLGLVFIGLLFSVKASSQSYFTLKEMLKICGSEYGPYADLVDKKGYKVQDAISNGVSERVMNFYKNCVVDGLYRARSLSGKGVSSTIAIYVDVNRNGLATRLIERVYDVNTYNKMKQDMINLGYTKEVLTEGSKSTIYYVKDESPVICLSAGRNTYGLDVWEIYVKTYSLHKAEKERIKVNQYKNPDFAKNQSTEDLEAINRGKYSNNAVKRELVQRYFNEEKYEKAYPLCIDLVNERDNFSCKYWEYLGFMYFGGLGVAKDMSESVKCFDYASKLGCISAKGKLYYYDLQLMGYLPQAKPDMLYVYQDLKKYYERLAEELPEAKERISIVNKKIKEEENKNKRQYNRNTQSGNRRNSKGSFLDLFKK